MKRLTDLVPKHPQKLIDNVNIWLEAAELTAKYKCISFAQGSPEFQPPAFLKSNMIDAIEEGQNQYCRSFGHPLLINKVAEIYGKKLQRKINSTTEVLISHGATGALFAFLSAYVNKDEQVVSFTPMFQFYFD